VEALKLLLGIGDSLVGRLQLFDALRFQWREMRVRRNPDCPVCGDHPTIRALVDYDAFCGVPQARAQELAERDGIPEITAIELKSWLDRGDALTILDVREPHEWDIASLAPYGSTLIPLDELAARLGELEGAGDVVVHCRSGVRSAKALRQLHAAGFDRVWNLKGGILAWSDEVDPSVPKY
jgi:adenylyltransferase/sulfurtransferase